MNGTSRFIVLADGRRGTQITRLARKHADYDPEHRRVIARGDDAILAIPLTTTAAAVVVSPAGVVCAQLDSWQAMTEGWIEDAFVRAMRPTTSELPCLSRG